MHSYGTYDDVKKADHGDEEMLMVVVGVGWRAMQYQKKN